ncbi:hypothetical protein [uncultured Marinobacter sp.]|uniref:hypothetical protein n=1 Tax=uncultured Marinobacter sp. TaxID=187379 RepID=UPI0030DB34E7
MTSPATERSWLFDPSTLKLVHQCRKLIQMEFGVKLHLTDEALEQRLASYAGKSRSASLGRTWRTLQEQVPGLKVYSSEAESGNTAKTLRGQTLADRNSSPPENPGDRPVKTITYRGQTITV